MTNKEFIQEKATQLKIGQSIDGSHNSLYASGDAIYSYGYHYPLLFRITNPNTNQSFLVCNVTGYSSTTSKHINYANDYADIRVKLNGKTLNNYNYNLIINALNDEINDLQTQMDGKKAQGYLGLRWFKKSTRTSHKLFIQINQH